MSGAVILNPLAVLATAPSPPLASGAPKALPAAPAPAPAMLLQTSLKDTAYFTPEERFRLRASFHCCRFLPVCCDFSLERHRSRPAAALVYLQAALSTLLLLYAQTGPFGIPSCRSAHAAQPSLSDLYLYPLYLLFATLALSRFQSPPWLFVGLIASLTFFAVSCADELPHCASLSQTPAMALAGNAAAPPSLLLVSSVVAAYGFFKWLATLLVTCELLRLCVILMRDITCRGARLSCAVDDGGEGVVLQAPAEAAVAAVELSPAPATAQAEAAELVVDAEAVELPRASPSANTTAAVHEAAAAPKLPLRQVVLDALLDAAKRPAEVPVRHFVACMLTSLFLLFIAAATQGWCNTFRVLLATFSPSVDDPTLNSFLGIVSLVLQYLPYGVWLATACFWGIHVSSIYAVSNMHRHLRQRYALAKEGVRHAGMEPLLDQLRAPNLSVFIYGSAPTYVVAHLLCNLISFALAAVLIISIIVGAIVSVGLEAIIGIVLSVYSWPFILNFLQGQAPTIARLAYAYGVVPITARCGAYGEKGRATFRLALAYACCCSTCGADGPHLLLPRFFLFLDNLWMFVVAPFTGALLAVTRAGYGVMWGIVALAQLHEPLLPPLLARYGFDKPYLSFGGMLRSAHAELMMDEELGASVPTAKASAAWR